MSKRVLVLGGRGFVGRHAVASLSRLSLDRLAIGTRTLSTPINDEDEVELHLHERTHPKDWIEIVSDFDVVLNCVGILRPVGTATYDRVHHLAPKAIASACRDTNTLFIHVSALGLSEGDRSRFLSSKRLGEHAISESGCPWLIVRPSLLDGEGGFGSSWLRGVARLPMFASPMDARGEIAAFTATDLGEALAILSTADWRSIGDEASRVFELGGTETFHFADYVRGLRRQYTDRQQLAVPIPGFIARLGAHLCDLFHFSPFSFGHWELLRKDNVPRPNRLPEVLGRAPQNVIRALDC